VKGVLGEEELLLEQAKKTLEPLKNDFDSKKKDQVQYYEDCFSELVNLNHTVKTYSTTSKPEDFKKFEDEKTKVMKKLTAFTDNDKDQ
jgi:hypothetical protein